MARKSRNIVIDWSDVKHRYIKGVEQGESWDSQPMGTYFRQFHSAPYREHDGGYNGAGGTPAQTLDWLRNGFRAPEFAHSAEMVPQGIKRRCAWDDEEGEPDVGRLAGGWDEFFFHSEERESKPGLRVQIEFAFVHSMPGTEIQRYGAWCAGLLGALEESGYDLVVDCWIPLDNLFVRDVGTRTNVLIRVKRENEFSDFTEWSALFGPTGYRHLGFTAKCVAGEKIGKRVTPSFGRCLFDHKWGVEYDAEDGLVKITAQQIGSKFDLDKMNRDAQEAGLLPKEGGVV